ncbi:acyltransferase family protein [Blastopirellula retiformator]|uniref:O-acetyltransferase OatA n=1 Tax=Blastopirellula retiformator TaxID=2527970 RepID=A0A5C5V9R8_9BACT|nr:acyltransferase family protein [Blastopirellula retiformator]TWT34627.1 O-acetyltransferase OatA [Blastopirellula retiformator]
MATTAPHTTAADSAPQSDRTDAATRDFKYRPDVDGLRALAVTLVLLFHAGLGFSGGFIGVDVFFVISGFLITGLVLKQLDAGTFSLKNFWVRRIRRILPASTVMVVLVLAAGYFLLLSPEFKQLAESAIAQQLMLSNVYFWRNTGYFAGPADVKPLLHTWSLGVEEQFYIGYPILLMLLHRFFRKGAFAVLVLIAVVSLALSQYFVNRSPAATFYLLPTRAWEMLLGGLICFLPRLSAVSPRVLSACSWISLGAILGTGWFYTAEMPFPGLTAIVPCLAAAALIYVNSEQLTWPAKAMATRPLVFVGLISYSLYLWHWPLFAFYRYWLGDPGIVVAVAVLAASFALAVLSWRFVETPIRQLKPGIPAYGYFMGAATSIGAIVIVASFVIMSQGFPGKFPEAGFASTDIPINLDSTTAEAESGKLPIIGDRTSGAPKIVFCGDSHLGAVLGVLDDAFKTNGMSAAIAARGGTPLMINSWSQGNSETERQNREQWKQAVVRYVQEHDISDVVLIGRWTLYIKGELTGETGHLLHDGQSLPGEANLSEKAVERSLTRTVEELKIAGVRVWIMKQVPLQPHDTNRQIVLAKAFGIGDARGTSREWNRERHANANRIIEHLQSEGVNVLDPNPYCFDDNGFSKIFDGSTSLYHDEDHLSVYGSRYLLTDFFDQFAKQLKESPRAN